MATAKKATKKTTSTKQNPNDAIRLLMADHKAVKELFKDYDELVEGEAGHEARRALAQRICGMLTVHAQIEEEIFYPAAREALDERDLLDEAVVEHASAKDLIAQIRQGGPSQDLYDAKVKVLGEYIDHHVKEEHNEMFPQVEATDLDLDALGEALLLRKEQLMAEQGLAEAPPR